MSDKIKCPICGTEIEDMTYEDCPYCDWTYIGFEDDLGENERDPANPVTVRQARENVKKGLNIWGDPLPDRK